MGLVRNDTSLWIAIASQCRKWLIRGHEALMLFKVTCDKSAENEVVFWLCWIEKGLLRAKGRVRDFILHIVPLILRSPQKLCSVIMLLSLSGELEG